MFAWLRWVRPGHLGTEADRATFRTLHTAALAAPGLREGLTVSSAERSARHLRSLLGVPAVAITDTGDLLAWDVPEHGSVWRPFAPARVTPWWREVPAWAMAVAATLVFALGAAGGMATHTFVSHDAVQAAPAPAVAAAPLLTPTPVAMSPADQAAFEQRVLARLDDELDRRVQQVSLSAGSKSDPQVARELK